MDLGLLLLLALGAGQDPRLPDGTETKLRGILKRLDGEGLDARARADEELARLVRSLGDRIGPLLRKHAGSSAPEVRARIRHQLGFLEQLRACRRTVSVFSQLGLPDCRGKKFVILNTGAWTRYGSPEKLSFHYRIGWVLSETGKEIVLAENNLTTGTYSREARVPDDWDKFKNLHPPRLPLPGQVRPLEFRKFCGDLLRAGTPEDFGDFDHFSRGGLPHALEPALYAHWAIEQGEGDLALKLVELSRKASLEQKPEEDKRSLANRLRDGVAENLRWQAITGANRDGPREKILNRWRMIARIAPAFRDGEVGRMVEGYESLAAEDARWTEPEPKALAKMDAPARAACWMYRLRDHAASQWSDPGSCYVLGPSAAREGKPNPADELVKLGWDALPLVIARLDDVRPTRCVGWWRSFAPSSYYLLRYGDCCQQIFEAITGFNIYDSRSTSGAMVKDGKAPTAKAAAEAWWKENREKGAERWYLASLDSERLARFAAEKLLEQNRSKHLPRLIELLGNGRPSQKDALLPVLAPHLGKEHEALLDPFLERKRLSLLTRAARVLWKTCGSDKGIRSLFARLKSLPPGEDIFFSGDAAFDLIAEVPAARVEDGLVELMGSKHVRIRMNAMTTAAKFASRKLGDALAGGLDDRTSTNWSSNYEIRFCDQAAEALILLAGVSTRFKLEGKEAARDRTIGELKSWWKENRDTLDWDALRRKRETERKPGGR